MKIIYKIVIILFTISCYSKYGVVLNEEKTNIISSNPHVNYALVKNKLVNKPKSIIFIIADGTGIGQYSLSYYANGPFAPSRFDHIGLVATHPSDGECTTSCKRVTDSAASGTALSAGIKTYNGAIGVNKDTVMVETMLELAEKKGLSTGIVVTSSVTHATPASFAAHIDYRKKEKEIAIQYTKQNIDVILGGGKIFWSDSLLFEYEQRGAKYIKSLTTPVDKNVRVLGLFSERGMPTYNEGRTPSTTEMAKYAINRLDDNPKGFFVMIEESQVDWGGHANSAEYIKGEMASLNQLVNYVLDYQLNHPDVLVILTADHECGGVAVHDAKNSDLDIRFTSDYHSANFVPIFASGPGAEVFDAFMDNTEIGKKLIEYINSD